MCIVLWQLLFYSYVGSEGKKTPVSLQCDSSVRCLCDLSIPLPYWFIDSCFITVTANRAIATSGVDHRPSQMKEVNRAAKFYFPNYASQKQKTVAVPASNDSNMRPYKHCTVSKPSTSEPRLPKQVSFIDETNNSAFKQPSSPKHQTSVLETGISNRLVLTTKNLEMYNSVTMAADLSLPSSEDNRIVSWIKERQQWESEPWEDIPELDEEINSASLDENASQTTSSLGR